MKTLLSILVVMVILFTGCERQSGKRYSKSGQAAMERVEMKAQVKTDTNIKVEVISEPERILIGDNAIQQYKTKVIVISDSTVCFTLLDNKFEIGDKISIKPTQRIGN